jgi:hypothetical protein
MNNSTETGYRLGFEKRTDSEIEYATNLTNKITNSNFSNFEKLAGFPIFAPRQSVATFLYKHELFKKVLNVHGSIVECGVAYGAGLMSFAQFSSIYEPVNYTRRIIGFDTFDGFPSVTHHDQIGDADHAHTGGMRVDSYNELKDCIDLYDQNRTLGHLPKVELVKGDALKTIPKYVEDNPHLVVSLLYLDFDLYEPTLAALKHFLPRMPKGAVLAFDELAIPDWSGETIAVMEEVGISNLKIQRVPYDTTRSFAIIE